MRAALPSESARPTRTVRACAATGLLLSLGTTGVALAPVAGAAPASQPTVTRSDTSRVHSLAGVLLHIRTCESGGRYSINTGNGYYGAYQFALATWHRLGYSGLPSSASKATQDAAAARLYAADGPSPWGSCG